MQIEGGIGIILNTITAMKGYGEEAKEKGMGMRERNEAGMRERV